MKIIFNLSITIFCLFCFGSVIQGENRSEIKRSIELKIRAGKYEEAMEDSVGPFIVGGEYSFDKSRESDYIRGILHITKEAVEENGLTQQFLNSVKKQLPPDEVKSTYIHALALKSYGFEQEAVDLFEEVIKKKESHYQSFYYLFTLYLNTGKYNKLNALLKKFPKDKNRSDEEFINLFDNFFQGETAFDTQVKRVGALFEELSELEDGKIKSYLLFELLEELNSRIKWNDIKIPTLFSDEKIEVENKELKVLIVKRKLLFEKISQAILAGPLKFCHRTFKMNLLLAEKEGRELKPFYSLAMRILKDKHGAFGDRTKDFSIWGHNFGARRIKGPLAFAIEYAYANERFNEIESMQGSFHSNIKKEADLRIALLKAEDSDFCELVDNSVPASYNHQYWRIDAVLAAMELRNSLPDFYEFYKKRIRKSYRTESQEIFLFMLSRNMISRDKAFLSSPDKIAELVNLFFTEFFSDEERNKMLLQKLFSVLVDDLDKKSKDALTAFSRLIQATEVKPEALAAAANAANKFCPSMFRMYDNLLRKHNISLQESSAVGMNDKQLDAFLNSKPEMIKRHISNYLHQGAELYSLYFEAEPEKANQILNAMIQNYRELGFAKGKLSSAKKNVWQGILNSGQPKDKLYCHFLNSIDKSEQPMVDLASRNGRLITSDVIIGSPFCKQLPDFFTFSGETQSALWDSLRNNSERLKIADKLKKKMTKTFGDQLLIELIDEYENLNSEKLLHIIGKRIYHIKLLPPENRQDFFRFFEAASKRMFVDRKQLTPEAVSFYDLYLSERKAFILEQLDSFFASTGRQEPVNLQFFPILYGFGLTEKVEGYITQALENKLFGAADYRFVEKFFPAYSCTCPIEYVHFLYLLSLKYNDFYVLDSLRKKSFYVMNESKRLKKGELVTYEEYLVRNPEAFLDTPFAESCKSLSSTGLKGNQNYPSMFQLIVKELADAEKDDRRYFHSVLLDQTENSFGIDFFTSLSSDVKAVSAVLKNYNQEFDTLQDDDRIHIYDAVFENFREEIKTDDPELFRVINLE